MSGLSDADREAVCICAEMVAVDVTVDDSFLMATCSLHAEVVEAIVTRAVNEASEQAVRSMAHLFRDMAPDVLPRRQVIDLCDLRADSYRAT